MKKSATLVAALIALGQPASAFACSVCFDANAETRWAFVGTTIFLSLLPLAIIGLIVLWLVRVSRAADELELAPEDA